MKKLISLMLALIMVLSLATVVGAETTEVEEASNDVTYTASAETSFKLKKTYNIPVNETLKFKVEKDGNENPDETMLTIADVTVGNGDAGATSAEITVIVPSYSKAGVYKYIITENEGTVQGVDYSEAQLKAVVYVGYPTDGTTQLVVLNTKFMQTGAKTDEYENTVKTGELTVNKTVTGNMVNKNHKFWVGVTITAESDKVLASDVVVAGTTYHATGSEVTYYAQVSATTPFTVSQIPADATVTVFETNAKDGTAMTADLTPTNNDTNGNYTQENITGNGVKVAADSENEVTIINKRDTTVATGIVTDSAPYIILIAVCAVAAVAFVLKRRNTVEF